MQDVWVNQIMSKNVSTCLRSTSLQTVVNQLQQQSFSCLVIVDEKNIPAGIITERDMVVILADLMKDMSWEQSAIENFMSAPPICINEDSTLLEAIDIIRESGIRHAPIINLNGTLTGILTQSDLIEGLYQTVTSIED